MQVITMTFPIYINLGLFTIHPHLFFEALAYFLGFRLYLLTRRKNRLPLKQAMWVITGATLGAAFGSKLLFWFEDPHYTVNHLFDFTYLMSGKTIVGGLLGGLIGVEWMKKRIGLTQSTGDDFVFPLITGIGIGRIGCFLTGLSDHTHGTPTNWITGVDFGDGILRHPTQLYEIAFFIFLAGVLLLLKRSIQQGHTDAPDGALFQCFMMGYLLFRLGIDFIKPTPHPYFGLNNIQLACLAGIIYYYFLMRKWINGKRLVKRRMPYA